jgi:hypothetical protein
MAAKFSLGQVVATPGAIQALADSKQSPSDFLALHNSGNWGDLDADDRTLNDEAIAHEGDLNRQQRVLSSYLTANEIKLWIITEWDRSVTTLLLPEEY